MPVAAPPAVQFLQPDQRFVMYSTQRGNIPQPKALAVAVHPKNPGITYGIPLIEYRLESPIPGAGGHDVRHYAAEYTQPASHVKTYNNKLDYQS